MKENKTVNFKEFFVRKGFNDVLLEMGIPLHTERVKVTFDQGDIDFLRQIPLRFWKRALRVRYGDLLVKALREREDRRMQTYWDIYRDFYEGKNGKPGYEYYYKKRLGELTHNRGTSSDQAVIAKATALAKEDAAQNAHYWTQLTVEKKPGYVHVSDKYEHMVLEFPDQEGTDEKNQRRTRKFSVKTGINEMIHRLETIEGHPRPDKNDPTIVGQLGYWMWGATHGEGGIPTHASGMKLLDNDGSAGIMLSRWINDVADEVIHKFDHGEMKNAMEPETDYAKRLINPQRHKYEWRESKAEDEKGHAGSEHTNLARENIHAPLYRKFRELLQFYQDAPDHMNQSGMQILRTVVEADFAGGGKLVDEPANWKSSPKALDKYASQLAWGYLWLKANPKTEQPYVNFARKGKQGEANGFTRVLYRLPDVAGTKHEGTIKLWRKRDGTFQLDAPKVHTWHERGNIHEIEHNPDGSVATNNDGSLKYKQVSGDEHWLPVLKPGKMMRPLPRSLWKKDEQLQNYHGELDTAGTTAASNLTGRTAVSSEWAHDDWEPLLAEDDGTVGDESEQKRGRPTGQAKFGGSIDQLHANHAGLSPTGNHAFPIIVNRTIVRPDNGTADYIELKRDGQTIMTIPTFGRFGNFIESKTGDDIAIEQYEKLIGKNGVAAAKEWAKQDHLKAQGDILKNNPDHRVDDPKIFYLKHLRAFAKTNLDPSVQATAEDNSVYISSFYKQLNEHVRGGQNPNQNSGEKHPLPRNSPEYTQVLSDVQENMGLDKRGMYKPISQGVALGLKRCESWYPGEITAELTASESDLYNLGWIWLTNNLADPRIMGQGDSKPDPDTVNKFIKNKVAQIVVDAGQQNITGSGTRKTRDYLMANQSLNRNVKGGEGEVEAGNLVASTYRRASVMAGTKRGPGDRTVTKSPFSSESILDSINDLSSKIRMEKSLDHITDFAFADDSLKQKLLTKHKLMDAIKEQIKITRGNQRLTENELTQLAIPMFYDALKKADKNFNPAAVKERVQTAAPDAGDRNQFGQNGEDFEKMKQIFSSKESVEKQFLSNKDAMQILLDDYENNPEATMNAIRAWSAGAKPGEQEEIIRLFDKKFKNADDRAEYLAKRDTDIVRGAEVGMHTAEDFAKKQQIERMLREPVKFRLQLLADKQPVEPMEFLQLVYARQNDLQMARNAGRQGVHDEQDMEVLGQIEVKARAAASIHSALKPDQGVIASERISRRAIKTMLQDLDTNLAFLSKPEILSVPYMVDEVQDRIRDLEKALDTEEKPSVVVRISNDLKNLEELETKANAAKATRVDPTKTTQPSEVVDTGAFSPDKYQPINPTNPFRVKGDPSWRKAEKSDDGQNPIMDQIINGDPKKRDTAWIASQIMVKLPMPPKVEPFFDPEEDQKDYGIERYDQRELHLPPEKRSTFMPPVNAQLKRNTFTGEEGQAAGSALVPTTKITKNTDHAHSESDLISYLDHIGIKMERVPMPVSMMVPSQKVSQLHQGSVVDAFENKPTMQEKPIIVVSGGKSSNKYIIVDGHHKWAGNYGHLLRYGVDTHTNVYLAHTNFDTLWKIMRKFWGKEDPGMIPSDVLKNKNADVVNHPVQSTTDAGGNQPPTVQGTPAAPPLPTGTATPAGATPSAGPAPPATKQPAAPTLPGQAKATPAAGPSFSTMLQTPGRYSSYLTQYMQKLPKDHPHFGEFESQMDKHLDSGHAQHHEPMTKIWSSLGL